jgi:hypothetical protein
LTPAMGKTVGKTKIWPIGDARIMEKKRVVYNFAKTHLPFNSLPCFDGPMMGILVTPAGSAPLAQVAVILELAKASLQKRKTVTSTSRTVRRLQFVETSCTYASCQSTPWIELNRSFSKLRRRLWTTPPVRFFIMCMIAFNQIPYVWPMVGPSLGPPWAMGHNGPKVGLGP